VLRSGLPETLPGRSINLCERGVAAVLSGELVPGEAVGVEIRLPEPASPLRLRALVRHHDKLRCGMEFVSLSAEQLAFLRQWARQAPAERPPAASAPGPTLGGKGSETTTPTGNAPQPRRPRLPGWIRLLIFAALLLLGIFGIFLWRWNRGWRELESNLPANSSAAEQPEARVPAETMEKLITHRVDPDYPEAARPGNLQGIIVLDVIIGRDGSVVEMHPLNGPEMLAHAAMDALRWWRFEPYRIDGKPLIVETTVAVEFKPPLEFKP
jgi:outer membrane biosynthesis protein TonB